jgi:hypothetical protein
MGYDCLKEYESLISKRIRKVSFKSVVGATCACLSFVSFNAGAVIVNADWKASGDNLISNDLASGLKWLDLTETYGLTYEYVSAQLGSGGQFEGFRYATNTEVQSLWSNFGIDLSAGAATSISGQDPNVETAAGFLGNTWNQYASWDYPFGTSGITADITGSGHYALGAHQTDWGTTQYETIGLITIDNSLSSIVPYGSYLVMTSAVPVPAAVWLFGSGMLGLIGIARRKKAA